MNGERKILTELINKAADLCRETECGACEYFELPYGACADARLVDLLIASGVRLDAKQATDTSEEKQATDTSEEKQATSGEINQPDIPTTSGVIDIEKIEVE